MILEKQIEPIFESMENFGFYQESGKTYLYFEKEQILFTRVGSSWSFTKLDNALSTGKKCSVYNVHFGHDPQFKLDFLYCLEKSINRELSPAVLLEIIQNHVGLDRARHEFKVSGLEGVVNFSFDQIASKRVYSPFSLDRIKPLKEEPKKWTLSHLVRALINDQTEGVKCEYSYTDDYAYDAAYNFGIGMVDGFDIAKGIIERPRGWRVSRWGDGYINFSFASCKSYQFKLSIK